MTERVCVGAIAGSFGVRGEVRLKSFCAEPEDIAAYGPLTTEDGARSFSVKITRAVKNGFAVRLGGVSTKEQADDLRGTRLYVERALLPSLPDDEYYYADLIGLTVFDTGGAELGRVKSVLNHGASDLLEIHRANGGGTALLPFTRDAVPTVDLASGRIVADPPDGVF
ncbi:MAG: ribosome maturation factor RimM [Paracoccaceae bacterium]